MVSRTIPRRLDALQQVADKIKPCRMIVTFADGSKIAKNPLSIWEIYFDNALREKVTTIVADSPQYQAAAGILSVLCRPMPNREIKNYE